jgi:Rad3-related DNA helicase
MSEATPPALDTGRDLLSRNAALASRLGALGARGSAAAAALAARGTPPPDDLVRALDEARREFATLRAEALAAAEAAGVATPAIEAIDSTSQLEDVLRALLEALEAAERRAALARVRAQALALLDRVSRLAHRDDPTFAPLLTCQKRGDVVRAVLDAAPVEDPERARAALTAAAAPFAALLTLMEGARGVDDEQWAALEDAVAEAFGRPLAAAATRGRLLAR